MDRGSTDGERVSGTRGVRVEEPRDEAGRAQDEPQSNSRQRAGRAGAPNGDRAPVDTGTPGGGLGAPDEAGLKRDPEAASDKSDSRMQTDER